MAIAPSEGDESIPADTSLLDCPEVRLGLSMPSPLSDRIDDLVARAEAEGERTNRKELVAALVLAAASDGRSLARSIRRLRHAKARDALLEPLAPGEVVPAVRHRPGPRPRRGRSSL